MDQIITNGKSKQEAIEKALGELGLQRSEVRVEVLEEGSRGFLGLGGRNVKLRVSRSDGTGPLPENLDAEKVARSILDPLGIDYKLESRREEDVFYIKINSKRDEGLLIGRRGQTLDSIKHLIQRVLTSQAGQAVSVNLEVGDYRRRREEALREKADAVAAKVVETGKSLSLEPMTAQDRRIVHLALADREGLRTYTAGDGSRRRVVVALVGGGEERKENLAPASPYEDIPDPGFRATSISSMARPRREGEEQGRAERKGRRETRRSDRPARRGRREDEAPREDNSRRGSRHDHPREEGGTRIRKTFRQDRREEGRDRSGESRRSGRTAAAAENPQRRKDEHASPRVRTESSSPRVEANEEKPFSSDLAKSVLGFGESKAGKARPKKRRYR